jgi:hypothetical protein
MSSWSVTLAEAWEAEKPFIYVSHCVAKPVVGQMSVVTEAIEHRNRSIYGVGRHYQTTAEVTADCDDSVCVAVNCSVCDDTVINCIIGFKCLVRLITNLIPIYSIANSRNFHCHHCRHLNYCFKSHLCGLLLLFFRILWQIIFFWSGLSTLH